MKNRLRIGSMAAASLLAVGAAEASAAPPITKRFVGTLITPADAWTYYGSATTHTNGIASSATRAPEIRALARSLSRDGGLTGDAFIQRVADYVHKNIQTEFLFGLGKGARGAAIDQSGTVFDQAHLMVEILRERGQAASYQLGTISLTADQFGKWTGHVNGLNQANQTFSVDAKAACQMLADGGIPATVNGATSCGSLTAGAALSSVTMAHVWVLANGKAYDPGFKVHILKAGIDIPAAMGCGNAASPTCGASLETQALTGASQGTAYSASYIQNINQAAVESYVQARAVALQGVLQSNPTQSIEDAVGGTVIDLKQSVSSGTSLPYQASTQASWSGDVPDQFRTAFQVQFMGLNSTLYADEIAGSRVRLVTTAEGTSFSRTSTIVIEGANVAQATAQGTSAQVDRPTLSVNHPFAANAGSGAGTYGDDSTQIAFAVDQRNSNGCWVFPYPGGTYTQCGTPFTGLYTLYLDVGAAGRGREQNFSKLMTDSKEGALAGGPSFDRRTNAPPTAAKHALQTSEALGLVSNLSKTFINQMHGLGGLFSQDMGGDGRLYFNLSTGLTSASRTSVAADADAAFASAAAVSAAMEGSVFQQSEDAYESGASVSMFKLANAQGHRFYLANSGNISSVFGGTSNYNTDRRNMLINHVSASGSSIILPNNGYIGSVSMPAGGTISFSTAPELYYDSAGIGYLLNEQYKGGGAVAIADPAKDALAAAKANSNSVKDKQYFGVDLASGVINLMPSADLTVGSGVGALEFKRKYSSASVAGLRCNALNSGGYSIYYTCDPTNQSAPSMIQGGWDHSLNVTAGWSGNGSEGLGDTSALRASRAIAALYGLIDTNRSTTFQRRMTGIFVTYSLIESFVRNSVTTSVAGQFVRLPDGSFDPPPESRSAKLGLSGSSSATFVLPDTSTVMRDYSGTQFDLTLGDGTQWTLKPSEGVSSVPGQYYTYGQNADNKPVYAPTLTKSAIGLQQSYSYTIKNDNAGTSRKVISGISNSVGNALALSYLQPESAFYSGNHVGSVTDGSGRSATFGCASDDPVGYPAFYIYSLNYWDQCGINVTDAVSGVSKYRYVPSNVAHTGSAYPDRLLKSWYTPSNGSTAYLTLSYDPVLHVSSYQDIAGRTTKAFVSNITGDRYRIGELQDPLGAVTSTIFDEHASAVQVTDPIGRVTKSVYDDARRVLRTVFPEGNAVEYSYDVRGNRLTECQIAKGRVTWANLTTLTERTPQCNVGADDLLTQMFYMEGPNLRADQCTNPKTCNKLSYMIDPRNKRTDYEWSSIHGQLISETLPPDNSTVRPVTTLGYTPYSTGDGATFYLLTSKTQTINASTSFTTTYEYDANNRYALKSSVMDSGGAALRMCYKFDAAGNLVSQTTPRGTAGGCP